MTVKNDLPEQTDNNLLGRSTRRTASPTHDIERVFDQLFRRTVGFDYLPTVFNNTENSFPRYDIYKQDNETYVVEIALAGYSPDDINVSQSDWELIVSSDAPRSEEHRNHDDFGDSYKGSGYLHKGIAKRSFMLKLALGLHTEVTDAVMKDGMLYVTVKQHDQDSNKPISVRKE